ncbi:hypothetical protein Ccrd_022977 [Cynara cardunculus var. scolymus]|uniref:Replication protein A 70 kDa DNA-binding subunit B/D first OB fold domain-containing protein n=1 Tax=Cynara cardunculus var. scolymus TaxID=59895 RepID=A0A103XXM9_CYNCS|nr:hypothetical protein Ccrd_022977 [Cynara cardunculus var. scolymus]
MTAIVRKILVNKFNHLLKEGNIYVLKNFKVVENSGAFKVIDLNLKIIFTLLTKVENFDIHVPSIRMHGFQLSSEKIVNDRLNDDNILTGMSKTVNDRPTVERLPFHLPGEQPVQFNKNDILESVVVKSGVWNAKDKIWTRRKNGISIGIIYFTHLSSGERFYMRMLFVKGCTSYEHIGRVNGIIYPSFREANDAIGLLDGDDKLVDCLTKAANWATGH